MMSLHTFNASLTGRSKTFYMMRIGDGSVPSDTTLRQSVALN